MENSILETIKSRRTTRAFQDQPVAREQVEAVVEAGLYAPSAHNQQSWHFTVINDPALLAELNTVSKESAMVSDDDLIRKMAGNADLNVFYGAKTVILVSGDSSAMMPQTDCAAAAQNMLLAAEGLGLGACWNGFIGFLFAGRMRDEYLKKLQIPDGFQPYYAIVLGHKKTAGGKAPERRAGTVTWL